MRLWFSGPRILGIRPGISLGRGDLVDLERALMTWPAKAFLTVVFTGMLLAGVGLLALVFKQ